MKARLSFSSWQISFQRDDSLKFFPMKHSFEFIIFSLKSEPHQYQFLLRENVWEPRSLIMILRFRFEFLCEPTYIGGNGTLIFWALFCPGPDEFPGPKYQILVSGPLQTIFILACLSYFFNDKRPKLSSQMYLYEQNGVSCESIYI